MSNDTLQGLFEIFCFFGFVVVLRLYLDHQIIKEGMAGDDRFGRWLPARRWKIRVYGFFGKIPPDRWVSSW